MPQHALKVVLDHRKINVRLRRASSSINRSQRRFDRADLCIVVLALTPCCSGVNHPAQSDKRMVRVNTSEPEMPDHVDPADAPTEGTKLHK
jgi:hypothetical protein